MNAAFRDSNNAATSSTFMHASGMGGGGRLPKNYSDEGGGAMRKKIGNWGRGS